MNHFSYRLIGATRTALAAVLLFTLSHSAFATRLPAHPISAATLAPTAWSVGRFPPRVWTTTGSTLGRMDVLNIGVDAQDGPTVRPPATTGNFYNIQGREISFPSVQAAGVTVAGSLYIPSSWNTSNPASPASNRRSELLLQYTPLATDGFCPAGNDDCLYYGAIGFSSAQITDQLAGGGPARIRILKKGIADGWINLTTPFLSDAWNDLCVSFTGSTLEYYLNGALVFTDSSLVAIDPSQGAPNRLRSVSVENYNFGSTFDASWSDLEYGARASVSISRSASVASGIFSATSVVRNTGSSVATNVQVIEAPVAGLSLISVAGACTALPCSLSTLNAGETRTYTSSYAISASTSSVSNSAVVRTEGVDCVKSDNTASVSAGVLAPVQVPLLNGFGALALMFALAAFAARRLQT
jgi:hypothetical protein